MADPVDFSGIQRLSFTLPRWPAAITPAPAPPPSNGDSDPGHAEIARLLDAGDLATAEAMIAALQERDPADPIAWKLQAVLLAERGDDAGALAACRRAIALWPDIAPVYRLLIRLADRTGSDADGLVPIAEQQLLASDPDDPVLCNRIATRLCTQGRFSEALAYLRISAPVLGHRDSALWNYSLSLALTGAYHELLAIEPLLVRLSKQVPPPFSPFAHLAAAKLGLHHDRDAACRRLAAIHASENWLDAAQLGDRLREAIDQRRPFSVFRLAEPAARLVTYASLRAHLVLNEPEMSAVINSVWIEAHGDAIETHGAPVIGALVHRLLAAIADADVIAMPDEAHLAAAHEHFGLVAEMQQIILARPAGYYAGLRAIDELHETLPFLHLLLVDQPFLGFVGSHPDLAERLAVFTQTAATATYQVPAALNRADIPDQLRGRDHFPGRLEQVLADLVVPFPGAVFLVAAGLLGPLYCGRIKQLGGIAIDIDTLAARWMPD